MERGNRRLSVQKQRELLGIPRSSVYYTPKVSERKIEIMNAIDEIYTKDPTSGKRKVKAALRERYGIVAGLALIRKFFCEA